MRTAAGPKQSEAPAGPAAAAATKRLVSLDAFRGWTMFWIIGGTSIVDGLQALGQNPVIATLVYQLNHTPWQGLRYYDVIWPSFMLMTGMSVPFSYARRSQAQSYRDILLRVIRRVIVLLFLGSLRESVSLNGFYLVELSSALQPIAIAYLAAFLLVRQTWRFQAGVAAGILIGYAFLLAFVPAPGVPAGSYANGANLVAAIDLAVLGRTHPEGWGTVLSTIPTIATTIVGMLIGRLLLSPRTERSKLVTIGLVGAGGVVLGVALDPIVPIVMKLWTTSYGIASAGWACLLFLVFYWAIDVGGHRRWAFPLVVIGMNAVAVYMSRSLIPLPKIVGIYSGGMAAAIGAFGPLFQALTVLLVEWLILYWMYRRKIFLTA
jgi:predicted acyltransferase